MGEGKYGLVFVLFCLLLFATAVVVVLVIIVVELVLQVPILSSDLNDTDNDGNGNNGDGDSKNDDDLNTLTVDEGLGFIRFNDKMSTPICNRYSLFSLHYSLFTLCFRT